LCSTEKFNQDKTSLTIIVVYSLRSNKSCIDKLNGFLRLERINANILHVFPSLNIQWWSITKT